MTSSSSDRTRAAAHSRREQDRARRRRVRTVTAVGAVAAVGLAGLVVTATGGGTGAADVRQAASTEDSPRHLQDGALVTGSGPVTVTLYEDLQCPACRSFEQRAAPVLDELVAAGTVRLERRPMAFLDRASTDAYSTRALNAVGCAVDASADAGARLLTALWAEQPPEGGAGLPDARLTELAAAAGAPGAGPCVEGLRFKGWTERSTAAADAAGVRSTPTVLVAGQVLQDTSPTGLRAAVAAAQG